MSSKHRRKSAKSTALSAEGTLNPAPDKVGDPKFRDNEFFDAHDIVQVKYEMLRRVLVENASVTQTTQAYGVSRPVYYQAKASFDEGGIAGLVPKKRGPHASRKIQGEVRSFVQDRVAAGEPLRARKLAALIRQEFGMAVHPRTIERAMREKKTSR